MSASLSSFEYLGSSSDQSLEAFELSRLNRAANCRKQIVEIYESLVEAEVEACIARCILDRRREGVANSALALQTAEETAVHVSQQLALQVAADVRPALGELNARDAVRDGSAADSTVTEITSERVPATFTATQSCLPFPTEASPILPTRTSRSESPAKKRIAPNSARKCMRHSNELLRMTRAGSSGTFTSARCQ